MEQVIVIRYGEVALKGGNREAFERRLMGNVEQALAGLPVKVRRRYGRLVAFGLEAGKQELARERLERVFGIENFSFGVMVEKEVAAMAEAAVVLLRASGAALPAGAEKTFRIRAKRSDKTFAIPSMELAGEVGARCLAALPDWRVRMVGADAEVHVEVTEKEALVSGNKERGPGGLPVGSAGRVACLLSGGIDSPVAAWYLMKRGCVVDFIHFHSLPFTSRASVDKVRELAEQLRRWGGAGDLLLVPFLDIQKEIKMKTDMRYGVVLYRRFMLRIAERLARKRGCKALVTGESLGQVASQTLDNIATIQSVAQMPILRPLIGFDKQETIAIAKRIGTYDISIVPHEDCCTLFVPGSPATRAREQDAARQEQGLDVAGLVEEAVQRVE